MVFRIDLKIFLLLILFYITKQIEFYAIIMFFAIIHELGHLLTGLTLGMKPEKIELKLFGLSVSFKISIDEYNKKIKKANMLEVKKIIVALAGPITNLLIILIANFIHLNDYQKNMIIYSNLLLILINMLPIFPLDGGRVLKGLLHIILGKNKAEKYSNKISFITLILLTTSASILILYIKNIAIFLIIVVLFAIHIRETQIYKNRQKIMQIIEEQK